MGDEGLAGDFMACHSTKTKFLFAFHKISSDTVTLAFLVTPAERSSVPDNSTQIVGVLIYNRVVIGYMSVSQAIVASA